MIDPQLLQATLEVAFPASQVEVFDKTGASDHFIVYICSELFVGKNPLARHRAVNDAVAELIKSGQLHAIEIKTDVPTPSQSV
jgi:stress-induced morphogen